MGEGQDQKMTVDALKDHLGTLSDPEEIEALLEDEDRSTAREAIETRLREVEGADNTQRRETIYPASELIGGAAGFGVSGPAMAGALHAAGYEEATRSEAEAALKAWSEREV